MIISKIERRCLVLVLIGIITASMIVPCQLVVQALSYQQPSTSKPVSYSGKYRQSSSYQFLEQVKPNLISSHDTVQTNSTLLNNTTHHQGGREIARINVSPPGEPLLIDVDPDKNLVYVTYLLSDIVSVINGSSNKR